jgi:hypothetical protein
MGPRVIPSRPAMNCAIWCLSSFPETEVLDWPARSLNGRQGGRLYFLADSFGVFAEILQPQIMSPQVSFSWRWCGSTPIGLEKPAGRTPTTLR